MNAFGIVIFSHIRSRISRPESGADMARTISMTSEFTVNLHNDDPKSASSTRKSPKQKCVQIIQSGPKNTQTSINVLTQLFKVQWMDFTNVQSLKHLEHRYAGINVHVKYSLKLSQNVIYTKTGDIFITNISNNWQLQSLFHCYYPNGLLKCINCTW